MAKKCSRPGPLKVIVHTWGRQALATQTWTELAPAAQVKRQRSPMYRRRRFHFPCRGAICVSYRYTGSSATYSTRPCRAGSRPTCRDSRTWMASPSRLWDGW